MGTVAPATLHVDTGTSWRGGQQQAIYLTEGLQRAGCRVAVVCRPASPLEAGCGVRGIRCFSVPMRGEMDVLAGLRIAALSRRHGFELLHLHTAH
ncbi:MAG: glycosyltransferase family 4 protein, partial [Candidatus Eisenbacteria bacterium]|nr:glycosyltransferase family 4 protein [Candidatus Eisenbacteria bacterium]